MNKEQMRDITDVCGMLSDATRISIVESLAASAKSVGELCKKLEVPQPTMSHHLGLLRRTRLVDSKRDGKQMIYSLNRKSLSLLKGFLSKVC